MTDRDEIERYEKLLNDWQPQGRPAGPKPTNTQGKTTRESPGREREVESRTPHIGRQQPAFASREPGLTAAKEAGELHKPGAMLLIDERALVIYKRAVPEKEYHLVCTLLPKGAVRIEGLALDAYEVQELGTLPEELFAKLQDELFWDRDLVVYHCSRFEDARRVPREPGAPAPTTRETAPAEASVQAPPAPAKNQLMRGKRLRVKFGDKAWDAVYWGHDEQGPVVAHNTTGQWALMHLDLERFKDGLEIDPNADSALVDEIADSLLKK